MSIRVVSVPGGRGGMLRVYCDECNELIENAGFAMYAWEGEAGQSEGGAIPYILHKMPCSDLFQERSGFERFSWQELIRFPFFFGEGATIDWHQVGELREVFGLPYDRKDLHGNEE